MVGTSSSKSSNTTSKTSNTKRPQSSTQSSTSSTASGRSPTTSTRSSTTSEKEPVNSTRSGSTSGRNPGPTTSTRSSTSSSDHKPRSSTRSSTTSSTRSTASGDKSKVSKSVVTKRADSKSNNKSSTSKTSEKTNPSHPSHPLEKVYKDYTYKCDGCKMRGAGTRYKCKPCKYNLHPDCMFARSKRTFEGYKCQLHRKPLRCRSVNCSHGDFCRSCDACGMTIEGFVYHCEEKDRDFHPSCAKLKSEIRIEDVIFKLEKHPSSKCLRCQKKKIEGTSKNVPGWSYVSNRNGYSLHVHCLTDLVTLFTPSKTANKKGSDMALALRSVELPLESKSKGKVAIGGDWTKVIESFLKITLVILTGAHPATLLVSLIGIGLKEVLEIL